MTGSSPRLRRPWYARAAGRPVVIAPDGTVVNRKMPVGGFPWAIGYEVTDEKLFVLAVFHQHRKPEYWTDRASI